MKIYKEESLKDFEAWIEDELTAEHTSEFEEVGKEVK